MHRRELARRRKEIRCLGAAGSAGGGGGVLLLPELGGTFRRVARGLVKVKRGLNWAEGGCAGWLLVRWISGRNGCRCLWWSIWAVVGVWVVAREVWKGGGLVSWVEDFAVSLGRILGWFYGLWCGEF